MDKMTFILDQTLWEVKNLLQGCILRLKFVKVSKQIKSKLSITIGKEFD